MASSAHRQPLTTNPPALNLKEQIELLKGLISSAKARADSASQALRSLTEKEITHYEELLKLTIWLSCEDKTTAKYKSTYDFCWNFLWGGGPIGKVQWLESISDPLVRTTRMFCFFGVITLELQLTNALLAQDNVSDYMNAFLELNDNFNKAMEVLIKLEQSKDVPQAVKSFHEQCASKIFASIDGFLSIKMTDPHATILAKTKSTAKKLQLLTAVLEEPTAENFRTIEDYVKASQGYNPGKFSAPPEDIDQLRRSFKATQASGPCIVM